jgi:hypothetical protein
MSTRRDDSTLPTLPLSGPLAKRLSFAVLHSSRLIATLLISNLYHDVLASRRTMIPLPKSVLESLRQHTDDPLYRRHIPAGVGNSRARTGMGTGPGTSLELDDDLATTQPQAQPPPRLPRASYPTAGRFYSKYLSRRVATKLG